MAYVVKKGDTASKIAAELGVPVDEILAVSSAFSKPGDARTLQVGATIDLGGSEGAAPAATAEPQDTYTGDEDVRFVGLAGRPEIWQESGTGDTFIIYHVPGREPPIPMAWKIRGEEDLKSFFGDAAPAYDKVVTQAEMDAAGTLDFGEVDELVLQGENPFSGWVSQFEREMEVLPWLEDPEVAALFASSWLEGRAPTEAELAGSDWFQSKTQGEQQWVQLLHSQPKTAGQMETSNRIAVKELLRGAGIDEAPEEVVNYIADQWTHGLWTEQERNVQIALLADPTKKGDRDTGLLGVIGDTTIDTTTDKVKYVEDELRKWLGPVYGQWSQSQKDSWVGKLRNDPDADDAFKKELQRQRLAMMPEYDNEMLSYEDIATPWRNFAYNEWGQNVSDEDPVFQQILKTNDAELATEVLRREGLKQGIGRVEDKVMADMARSFGSGAGVRGIA